VKQIGINIWQMDDGTVISGREKDFLTYNEGSRFLKIPVEIIVKDIINKRVFGTAIYLNNKFKWSNNENVTDDEISTIKNNISKIGNSLGYFIFKT